MSIIFKSSTIICAALLLVLGGCSEQKPPETSGSVSSPVASNIKITEWQPRTVAMGASFNVQPNGDSGLWFIAPGIQTSDKYEFWFGDNKIDALFVKPNESGTVTVPKVLLNTPGKYNLYLLAKADNKKIELGVFEIRK